MDGLVARAIASLADISSPVAIVAKSFEFSSPISCGWSAWLPEVEFARISDSGWCDGFFGMPSACCDWPLTTTLRRLVLTDEKGLVVPILTDPLELAEGYPALYLCVPYLRALAAHPVTFLETFLNCWLHI